PERVISIAMVRSVLKIVARRNRRKGHGFASRFTLERTTILDPISSNGVDRRIRRGISPEHKFFGAVGIREPRKGRAHEANEAREFFTVIIAVAKQGHRLAMLLLHK